MAQGEINLFTGLVGLNRRLASLSKEKKHLVIREAKLNY